MDITGSNKKRAKVRIVGIKSSVTLEKFLTLLINHTKEVIMMFLIKIN